jgi:putative colanic acid biosynthesis UDP-glucose lipid carrier transferase
MSYRKREYGAGKSLAIGKPKVSRRPSRNWTISYRMVTPLAMIADAAIIICTSELSALAYQVYTLGIRANFIQHAGLGAIVAALFIALGKNNKLYDSTELLNLKAQARQIAVSWTAIFLFLSAVAFTMKVGEEFSRGAILTFATSGLTALIGARIVWRVVLADGLAVRKFAGRKIALIADQEAAGHSDLLEVLARHGLQLAHHFILPVAADDAQSRRNLVNHVISSIRGSDIEEIVVSANLNHWPELSGLLAKLRILPLPVHLVPIGPASALFKLPAHEIGETVTIELQRGPRTLLERFTKRVIDIVIAGGALIGLFPLLLLTAIAIKLDRPGPVIFRQRRCGFNGRRFHILKFRTMSVQEDGNDIAQAARNDRRITPVGRWLRRTSIDELPQLINVLRGEMSIVGPRPHAVAHDDQFEKIVGKYAYRHHVKPGITGWAQVHGYRGETRTVADIERRTRLDLWYIDNWSLILDFKIVLMTAIEIIRGENAY